MPTQRQAVADYLAAMKLNGAQEVRLQLATDKAVALAKELSSSELRHADKAAAAIARFEAAVARPDPAADDFEGRLAAVKELDEASKSFWDAFEGQVVDGVEIIRRRA